ncbi:ATP-binding protein [Albidovulum sp.]
MPPDRTRPPARRGAGGIRPRSPRPDALDLCLRAEPLAVREALRAAVACYARDVPSETVGTLQMALAEVLNNIVEHAYLDRGDGMIELHLRREGAALCCDVTDRGLPLAGLALPAGALPPTEGGAESLPEGGWGWALIRAVTTDLAYSRCGGANHLHFKIPLPCDQG